MYSFICIAANVCKCDDGTAKTGADCTTHDASMCARCDEGFTTNAGNTACLGIDLVACEKALQV